MRGREKKGNNCCYLFKRTRSSLFAAGCENGNYFRLSRVYFNDTIIKNERIPDLSKHNLFIRLFPHGAPHTLSRIQLSRVASA